LASGKRGGWHPKWTAFGIRSGSVDDTGVKIACKNDQQRHSVGSYSLAQKCGGAALATGNSPATLFKNYWNRKTLVGNADAFEVRSPKVFQKKLAGRLVKK